MSINAGSVYSELILDSSKYEKALNNAEKQSGIFSGNLAKIGVAVAAAFSVNAIIGFGDKLIQASASLQAMDSQFDQVFKDEENEKAIEGITKQVDDLGIHADRLTSSWNKFGGQVKGAGMDSEQALEAVDKATRLAADAAAFYDTSLENSSASLASFMKGNFEAGDAIGVFTNAKQMDIRANEMYDKSWADLTEAERQWLLLDTVSKTYELNGAMGQATREAGAYENTMGNLKATFERLWAIIGEPILDKFLIVVGNVTDKAEILSEKIKNGESVFNKFGEAVGFVKDNMDIILPILGGVTAAITAQLIINTVRAGYDAFKASTIATAIAQGNLNLVMAAHPFGLAVIAIGLLVTAGILLYKNWDTVKAKAIELADKIKETWENIKIKTVEAWNNIKTKITETVTGLVADALTWGKNMVEGLWDGIVEKAEWLKGKISGFIEGIKNVFTGKDGFDMHSPSRLMAEYGKYIDEGLAEGIENNKDKPISKMEAMSEAISGALQKISGYITSTVSIIEKEFDLWALKNDVVAESSEYLEQQLEMQRQKHELLNEQILATTNALDNATSVYGVGSIEALNYKNSLLDLQIQQENLANSVELSNDAIRAQNKLTAQDKDDRAHSLNDLLKNGWITPESIAASGTNILDLIGNNAQGTDYWRGGLTWIGEQGPELVELPRASKVYSNDKSKEIMVNASSQPRKTEVNLYIGTLIADDYGLKQLERRLSGIRVGEQIRVGGD